MVDREKAIKGLNSCAKWMVENDDDACGNCPYHHSHFSYDDNDCYAALYNDALALLKEQEPVKPDSFMDGRVQRFACKKCGKHLLYAEWGRDNYCSKCGKAVKWDD